MDLSMEGLRKREEFQNASSLPSPRSWNCINGSGHHQQQQQQMKSPASLLSITRSDQTNPYPTTFVQADTSNFKQVVQMLTGSSETAKHASASAAATSPSSPKPQDSPRCGHAIPPIKNAPPKRPQSSGFKLYERRQSNLKNSLAMINTLMINSRTTSTTTATTTPRGGFSPSSAEIPSPSALDFTNLALSSPVTPLRNHGCSVEDPFNKSSPLSSLGSSSEEERAIAEKGFYLHPSPASTPRDSEPQLLPLFPVTSPRLPSGSSS